MSILPKGTEIPKSSATGRYLHKFEEGKTRFRMLEPTVLAYFEAWKTGEDGNRKPIRAKTEKEVRDIGFDEFTGFKDQHGNPQKQIPSFVISSKVLHYDNADKPSDGGKLKILTIKQKNIITEIESYSNVEDWGDITKYDFVINREGEKLNTKYQVQPFPHKELAPTFFTESQKIDLEEFFIAGGDPFKAFDE